ncbi:entericidin A/B family lipoprotein [Suttonella indologenes]|uniref:Predicted small secreted protein n=1 Tax=Suttonella indologenes TaxID=13276 RepID=A0A380MYP7_9GAMM|nr:entericidin A/B family lipoprotein [Suttonella indologenes]SUO97432.1 Predicted small secreted protein [Suttonella indologenes]
MRKILSVLGLVSVLALAGCNAVKGVGQDVQKAGSGLENAAESTGGTGRSM